MACRNAVRWLVLCLLWPGAAKVHAGWLDPRFDLPGANGPIQSLVEFGGALYAVGYFDRIGGVSAPGVAGWDGRRWTAVQPGLDASVAAAVATDEAIYFAANRRQLSQPSGLVRWDGRTWTALGAPAGYRDAVPESLLVHGGEVYAEFLPDSGGIYATAALARWDGQAWSVLAPTRIAQVISPTLIAFAQEKIYAAGALYMPTMQAPLHLGQLVQTNWMPVGGGVGGEGWLFLNIASDRTNLFVAGTLTTVGSMPAEGFAIWDGSQWIVPPAAARGGASVVSLTENAGEVLANESLSTNLPSGQSLVSQHLVQYRGTNRTVLARGDAASMALMRRTADGVYCAGGFRAVGGVPTGNLALWTGTSWTRVGEGTFGGLTAPATCLVVDGTNVYVGGAFEYAGDVAARHIARWDGRRWHSLASGIDGTVVQMATRGDELFVIGEFSSAGAVTATNVARWNGVAWLAAGGGLSGELTAITATEQDVLVARSIDPTGFAISRWDGTGWSDIASGTFPYGRINTLVASGGSIFVGGGFESINGLQVNNVARWDGARWQSLGGGLSGAGPWNPNDYPFSEVRALLVDGTNLYAGGSFTNAGGTAARNVARWDGSQWSALGDGIPGWGRCITVGPGCIHPVTSLALVKGKLFAGGGFSTPFDYTHGFLALWDGSTWTNVVDDAWTAEGVGFETPFDPLHVWALGAQGSDLYLAGNFTSIGKVPSYGFGIWHEGGPPRLQIVFRGGRLVLSCPRQFQSAALEFAESLSSPLWKAVADLNWQVSQTAPDYVETETAPTSSPIFYRVRWD